MKGEDDDKRFVWDMTGSLIGVGNRYGTTDMGQFVPREVGIPLIYKYQDKYRGLCYGTGRAAKPFVGELTDFRYARY